MGYVRVRAKVSNVKRERSKEMELIADTSAIYKAIPEDILRDLGVVATGTRRFKTASGELKELPGGIHSRGGSHLNSCVPSERRNTLLGVTTLGLLGLQVDSVTGELKPMRLFLLGLM